MVEFALVAPMFFLVLFGIIEAGRFIFYYEILNNATREGARYAIVNGANIPSAARPARRRRGRHRATRLATTSRERVRDAAFGVLAAAITVDPMLATRNNGRGSTVTVSATFTYRALVPIVPLPADHGQRSRALSSTTRPIPTNVARSSSSSPAAWSPCCSMAALAFDVGMMLVERRDQQNAADAAALAGARFVLDRLRPTREDARPSARPRQRVRRRGRGRGRQHLHPGHPRSVCRIPGLHRGPDRGVAPVDLRRHHRSGRMAGRRLCRGDQRPEPDIPVLDARAGPDRVQGHRGVRERRRRGVRQHPVEFEWRRLHAAPRSGSAGPAAARSMSSRPMPRVASSASSWTRAAAP